MGNTCVAATAIFDRALAAHNRHLAFLHENIGMLNLGDIVFTASEGRLYEGYCAKGSPDLVAVKSADPREWYTLELKNGRNVSMKKLDGQLRRVKAVLGRRGVLARSVKIYRSEEDKFAVFIDNMRYLEYSAPTQGDNLEEKCSTETSPAQKFFANNPKELQIGSVLYSAANGRIMNGKGYVSADLVFVNARNPLHWYVVAIKKENDSRSIDDQLYRMRRILREHGIDATRIAVSPFADGYSVSIERQRGYIVRPEEERYRMEKTG